ncbi:MAG: YceH family protein [Candidatus Acidiferrum sp.]
MTPELSATEVRVLGALVEKETTTPEYYPLSVNALINACNQKSNRDPVMTLDEETVRKALRSLTDQAMARSAGGDSRVAKFEHRLNELYNFHRHEIAVLCVLMLRGPQTPGELRTRSERMYAFEDLDAVHAALNLLQRREPPLVKVLARQPGTKESRYMHLLSGDVAPQESFASQNEDAHESSAHTSAADADRISNLEDEVNNLRRELETLREQFATFQKQFQ